MINWILKKIEHYTALFLIKDPDWHVLMCDCREAEE